MIKTKPIEAISLPNGLVLEIMDKSRPIAMDTTKVEFIAKMVVALEESFFSCREHFETTRKTFGQQITYIYRKERTFVSSGEKDAVFNELVDAFKRDTLTYLSRQDFSRRFALSKYREIQMYPFKYCPPPDERIDAKEE